MKYILLFFLCTQILFSHITSNEVHHHLKYDIEYFEDSRNEKNIHNMIGERSWIKNTNQLKNFGYISNNFWLRISLDNYLEKKHFFEIKNESIENIDVFFVKEKKVLRHISTGLKKPLSSRTVNHRHFAFEFDESNIEIYVKIKSIYSPLVLPVFFYEELDFYIYQAEDRILMFLYVGIILLMFLFHIVIYFITNISFYKYYLMYMFFLVITALYSTGIFNIYFFHESMSELFIFLFKFTGLLMIIYLFTIFITVLNIKNKNPNIYRFILFLFIFNIVSFFIVNFFSFSSHYIYTKYISLTYLNFMILVLFMSILLLVRVFQKDLMALLLVFIWFPLFFGFILKTLESMNLIYIENLSYIIRALFVYETIFISLIVAYKARISENLRIKLLINSKEKELVYLRQERLVSMGEMLNNIAHQWKQPLARINGILMDIDNLSLNKKLNEKNLSNRLDLIEDETQSMSNIISSFTDFFQTQGKKEEFFIEEIIEYLDEYINKSIDVKISKEYENLKIKTYKEQYKQVLVTIIDNAIDEFKKEKTQKPKITIKFYTNGEKQLLEIENNASKIKKENLQKLFDPYFTTKSKDPNRGIGLYMAKILVEKNMGKNLKVENTQNGVKFIIED